MAVFDSAILDKAYADMALVDMRFVHTIFFDDSGRRVDDASQFFGMWKSKQR